MKMFLRVVVRCSNSPRSQFLWGERGGVLVSMTGVGVGVRVGVGVERGCGGVVGAVGGVGE